MYKNKGLKISYLITAVFLLWNFAWLSVSASDRAMVSDWYVKDFDSRIVVNKDSSLDITETILADCGNVPGKHGIYRVLPEKISVEGRGEIKTPVDLVSITDASGNKYNYSESVDIGDSTVTWKIGDADKTVQGENVYVIKYRVKNAIRFWNGDYDELYWNLTGNFWNMEIDKAHIEMTFPEEVKKENSTVDLYSGALGDSGNKLANYAWSRENSLEFDSIAMLAERQGITASVTFPKGIFIPYQPSFWELYNMYFFLSIPIIVFLVCLNLWIKYGKDPRINRAIIAEYDVPLDMSPLEMGMLMTNGTLKNHFITAEIINLATKKLLTIKEIDNKILFFHSKDYEFIKIKDASTEESLNAVQKIILNKLFEKGDAIKISSLRDSFYRVLSDVKDRGKKALLDKKLIMSSGLSYAVWFFVLGSAIFFGGFFLMDISPWLTFGCALSGIIFFIFGTMMPKRTLEGAETNWKIKGFKLFMETVDKDRAKFYEQENIFEKFLPYAIAFEITEIWIKRIKDIYGEDYFKNYAPVWYAGNLASFDADTFASEMNSLSSSIAANTSSPSGSGGSGSSGGGGGGGGGGGW